MALARSTHTAMLLRGACSRFLGPAGTSPPTVGARRQLALATAALSAGALWSAGSGGGTARAGCVAERTSRHSSATRESEQQGEAAERLDRLAAQLGVKKCGAAGCELGRDLTYAAPLATDCVPDPEDFKSALPSPPPPNPQPPTPPARWAGWHADASGLLGRQPAATGDLRPGRHAVGHLGRAQAGARGEAGVHHGALSTDRGQVGLGGQPGAQRRHTERPAGPGALIHCRPPGGHPPAGAARPTAPRAARRCKKVP